MATGTVVRPVRTCEQCGAEFTTQKRQARLCRVCATRQSLAVQYRWSAHAPEGSRRYAANG
jgi:hypothetical protein